MMTIILYIVSIVCLTIVGYMVGKAVGADALKRAKADLVTERSVRHNLNCLVGDLKHEFQAQEKVFKGAVKEAKRLDKMLHEQNVTVLEFSLEREALLKFKPDALAFQSLKGKWVTDNKHLVEYHIRKECFRRIGYPEERL